MRERERERERMSQRDCLKKDGSKEREKLQGERERDFKGKMAVF